MVAEQVVAVEMAARPDRLGFGRSLTRTIALGLGLALDEAADLELAVHEITVVLIVAAAPAAVVRYEYHEEPGLLRVQISAHTRDNRIPGGLGWYIAAVLARDLAVDYGPYDPASAGHCATAVFTWPRPEPR